MEMGSHHKWSACWIFVRIPQKLRNRGWDHPPIGEALEYAGLETIGIYVALRHNTREQYISMRMIFVITVTEEQKPVLPAPLQWWEQAENQFGDGGEAEAEGDDPELV